MRRQTVVPQHRVLILGQRRTFEAMGTKDGKVTKFVVDARTGRLIKDDDDD